MSIYDFIVKDIEGNDVSLKQYEGKVLLIVNTASKCGFTPQLKGLEDLYGKLKDKGFVVLGFPCNQFANQDPGSNEEILQFCKLNYKVSFPMFSKVKVNGKEAEPLFKYLRKQTGGILSNSIKWNFTKFLVNQKGEVIKRYAPTTAPDSLEEDIKALINE